MEINSYVDGLILRNPNGLSKGKRQERELERRGDDKVWMTVM